MTNATLEAALQYATRGHLRNQTVGWHVFPAKFAGKKKLSHTSAKKSNGNNWGHTSDPKLIRDYWRHWPSAAIGLPTGSVNGFFVVDIDTKAGGHQHDGVKVWNTLLADLRQSSPLTKTAVSPTGSRHLYFLQPKGVIVPTVTNRIADGVDTKGDGGFVIAPPSVRPGFKQPYAWSQDIGTATIEAAPGWLLDLVVERRRPAPTQRRIDPATCDPAMLALMSADAGRGTSDQASDNIPTDNVPLKIKAALAHIPANIDYREWFRIGCAIYGALGDGGYSLFDQWSSQSPAKYKGPDDTAAKWAECAKVRAINASTVYFIADQHDPGWRTFYKRLVDLEVGA